VTRETDHHDLLAWIEGEPLPPRRIRRLRKRLDADPALRDWAERIAHDRRLVQTWARAEEPAPAGLVDEAIEQIERDALVGPPRRPAEPGRAAGQRRIRVTPMRLAAAAGLALLVSSATLIPLLSQQPGRGGGSTTGQTPLAQAPTRQQTSPQALADRRDTASADAAVGRASRPSEQPVERASRPSEQPVGRASRPSSSLDSAETASPLESRRLATSRNDQKQGARANRELAVQPVRPIHPGDRELGMPMERVLSLLREGRLAVIVRSPDPASDTEAFRAAVEKRDPLPAGRMSRPSSLTIVQSQLEPAHRATLAEQFDWMAPDSTHVRVVRLAPNAEAVNALLTRVTANTQGEARPIEARLIALDRPIQPAAISPEQVLWWSRPASEWTMPASAVVMFRPADPSPPAPSGE